MQDGCERFKSDLSLYRQLINKFNQINQKLFLLLKYL